MKYEVINDFKVKTSEGIKEFMKGQIIPVHPDKKNILIEKGKIKPIEPSLDVTGDLIIPFDCDRKYHWWNGGQSVETTISDLFKITVR